MFIFVWFWCSLKWNYYLFLIWVCFVFGGCGGDFEGCQCRHHSWPPLSTCDTYDWGMPMWRAWENNYIFFKVTTMIPCPSRMKLLMPSIKYKSWLTPSIQKNCSRWGDVLAFFLKKWRFPRRSCKSPYNGSARFYPPKLYHYLYTWDMFFFGRWCRCSIHGKTWPATARRTGKCMFFMGHRATSLVCGTFIPRSGKEWVFPGKVGVKVQGCILKLRDHQHSLEKSSDGGQS